MNWVSDGISSSIVPDDDAEGVSDNDTTPFICSVSFFRISSSCIVSDVFSAAIDDDGSSSLLSEGGGEEALVLRLVTLRGGIF